MTPRFKKILLFGAVFFSSFFWFFVNTVHAALDWKDRLYDNQHFIRPSGVGNFANPNLLYTISLSTEPRWVDSNGFEGGLVVGDVDGDGKQEIVVGARPNNYDDYLYVYNGATGQLKNSLFLGSNTTSSPWINSVAGIILADLDSDGVLDIIVNSHAVRAYKGSDLSLMWTTASVSGKYLVSATAADVDGNGTVEVLAWDYGSPRKMHLFNGQTGNEIWSLETSGSVFNTPLVADINSDGGKEIVFLRHDGNNERVHALDKDGNQLWSYLLPSFGYGSATLADFDNDGVADILVGSDESIVLLNANGTLKWTYSTGADSHSLHYYFTQGAAVGDINNDGVLDIAFDFTDSDDYSRSGLFVLKGSNGTLQWSKTFPSSSPPYHNFVADGWGNPIMADFDNDGSLEVLFGYYLFTDDGADVSDYVEWHVVVYDGFGNKEFSIDNLGVATLINNIAVADVNNDNILDIIIGGGWFNKIFVYTGGGQASQRISINLTVPAGGGGGGGIGGGPGGSDVPPIIFNVASSTSFTTATTTWSASDDIGVVTSSFVYGLSISYGNSGQVTGNYKTNLSGLATGTLYYFKISATDTGAHTTEYTGTFSTSPTPPDITPPAISNVQSSAGVTTATIKWDTSELADSQINYGLTGSYGSNYFDLAGTLTHSALLFNLTPATLYHFKIISTDSAGNSVNTSDGTFTTRADSIPPPDVSGFVLTTTTNSIVLSWTNPGLAGTPDFSLVKVVRKIGSASVGPADGTVVYAGAGQSFTDTNASANIDYFYTIFSFDTSNNNSPGIFRNGQIVSVSFPPPVPIEICGNGLDDNGNGAADCADIACASLPECAPLPPPSAIGPEICGNGLDDDVNGLTDCADSACLGYSGCGAGAFVPACGNGADDDGDGKIDYPNDGGCESASDNDEYSPPVSSVPAFAKISLADLEFLVGNRLIKLEPEEGVVTGLSGAGLTVAVPEKVLASNPQSMILRVGDTDQHQFVYNANDKMYYAELSFYGVGMAQAYLEIDYGSGQFDSVAFKLNSLSWGQAVDSDDKPLADVKITLRSTDDKDIDMGVYGQINPIISDANGSYGWMAPDGDYQVFLRKEGYYDRVVARGNIVNNVINEKLILIAKPSILALAIDPEAPLVENVVNVAKNLAAQAQVLSSVAIQKVQDAAANPEVQKVNKQVVAPTAITVVVAGAISFISWMDFLPFLRLMFLQPLMLLGWRKREKWGFVYNSLSKLPIDLATVRLISLETNRVVQSKVTDAKGRFIFMVNPGKYRIEAQKNSFIFPSKFLEGYKSDGQKVDIYHGEPVEVINPASITASIPLDPVGAQKKPLRLVLEKFGRRLQTAISWLGILVTAASLYISPKWYIAALLVGHILLFFIFRRLAVPSKPKNWGIVYDEGDKAPIGRVIARLFNSQFNKLVDTQITDSGGKYYFMAGDGKYYVTYEHKAYHPQKTDVIDLVGKDAEVITIDVKLKKN